MLNSQNINANTLTLAVVLLLGLVLAVVVGDGVASGNYVYVGLFVLIAFGLPLGLRLGTNFWILIALTMTANGRLGFIPLPFNVSEIATIVASLLFAVHVVLRRMELKVPLHWPDIIILFNVGWLAVTFIKNPTGLYFLGSDSVGGRKYIDMGFAFIGYFVLSRCYIPSRWARYLPIFLAIGLATPYALQSIASLSPQLGEAISWVYGVQVQSVDQAPGSQATAASEGRIAGLERTALPLFLAMCAYYPPITFISPLYPARVFAFATAFVLVGLAGYRSFLLALPGYMAVATWLRGRIRDFIPLAAVGVIGIVVLAGAVQAGLAVPLTIQRALSVIPLGWDAAAVKDAEATTTWRLDMWRDAWNDPNYFKDKIFGDGFGFTQQELILFANQMMGQQGLLGAASYEMFIIRGSLHNGPLSSIRYGGFGGLALLTCLMIAGALYAIKVVKASSGSVYMPIALFTAIPLVYEPFAFFIIFGAYDQHMVQYFLGVGMLNLISRSLPKPVTDMSQSSARSVSPITSPLHQGIPVPAARLR
jgi:hypothetical protein